MASPWKPAKWRGREMPGIQQTTQQSDHPFRVRDGAKVLGRFATVKEAVDFQAGYRATRTVAKAKMPTFGRYAREWHAWLAAERTVRPKTLEVYTAQLNRIEKDDPAFWASPLDEITLGHGEKLRTQLRSSVSASYTRDILVTVKMVMDRAVHTHELILRNKLHGLEMPPRDKSDLEFYELTDLDIMAICEEAHGVTRGPIITLAFTGLREAEARGLTLEHCRLDRNQLVIEQQLAFQAGVGHVLAPLKSVKGRRTIDVPEVVTKTIAAQIETYGLGPHGLVFTGARTPYLSAQGLRYQWKRIVERIGLPAEMRVHDLRHNFVSHLVNNGGMSVPRASHYVGHSSIRTTERYLHPSSDTSSVAAVMAARLTRGEPSI